jgi:glutamate-1-semialdehyde 2,1-aminomutase
VEYFQSSIDSAASYQTKIFEDNKMEKTDIHLDNSYALFERAVKVIPGGIYGTKNPGFVIPGSYPYYFTRGSGSRLFDVDGNEYIDFLCGYGSQILGYGYDKVDSAAISQLKNGDLLTAPSPVMVELAERLTDLIEGMDWSVFGKNGTDATTLSITLARIHTDKKKVLIARGAYHGFTNWCSSNDYLILDEKKDVHYFDFHDLDEIKKLFHTYKDQIACIMLNPYFHATFEEQTIPAANYFTEIETLCRQEGALFIMDDIRANFRLKLQGSHSYFGCHPDMVTMGKSIANGQPISVLMGTNELKKTASSFFITGTFWFSAVPMAAAMACLDEMERLDIITKMNATGTKLKDGLANRAKKYGFSVTISGPPAIPFLTFKNDKDLYQNQIFSSEMTKRGIYIHPYHNWFISYAHSDEDIEQTLESAEEVFKLMAEKVT